MIEIRVGQLASKLGVHRNTVGNWIKSGKLKATPVLGRRYLISQEELDRFCRAAGLSSTNPVETSVPSARAVVDPLPSPLKSLKSEALMSKDPIGAIMVVGGGISGIQASLDLANSGYAVHLVERSAGIGGVMAQLDKTYPTNDCAM